jgi:hypothetical protein
MADNDRSENTTPPRGDVAAFTKKVRLKLEETLARLQHRSAAALMWERLLTPGERARLGPDFHHAYARHRTPVAMWVFVHPVWDWRAVIQLGRRLDLLSEADYRWLDAEITPLDPVLPPQRRRAPVPRNEDEDVDDQIEQARRTHRLVLVRGNGHYRVYWRGERVARINWKSSHKRWELLWTLAARAKRNRSVAPDDLEDLASPQAITDLKLGLRVLPQELFQLIKADGPLEYRLHLPPGEIGLFDLEEHQFLREAD